MKKFFSILENVIGYTIFFAFVAFVILYFLGVIDEETRMKVMGYIPYCYLGAAIVVIYKLVALVFTSFYQIIYIPLNKKLRNAELKQFVTNIIRYARKDYLDGDSFLQTAFCEWFSGKKENIAKNYSVLPKDSLMSKDGVEVDLLDLRGRVRKNDNNDCWKI